MKSELPSTFKAFRFQQHRWSCGPANLFRKMVMEIIRNKVSLSVKNNQLNQVESTPKNHNPYENNQLNQVVDFCFTEFLLQKVNLFKKVYVIYSFFFVRKIIAHMVTFFFFCVVLPLTILVPEVEVPKWGAIYIPCIITAMNSVGTPRSLLRFLNSLSVFYNCVAIISSSVSSCYMLRVFMIQTQT